MHAVDIITDKRNNQELTREQIAYLVEAYTKNEIPDYQMSAFLMAVYFNKMTRSELAAWTDCMLHSGKVFDLSDIDGYKVDKHSTGGVGDKISLILAPLAVAAGLKVPMISGRGLGHTGGTLDKLETIPGFNVNLPFSAYKTQVSELGCALIGQTEEVAPADKRLYALRDVTATVESIPLIASSIMSKKLAEGIDGLVLDVKVGNGAFMKTVEQGKALAETMIEIGKEIGTPVRALLTNMDQPLGHTIGNALEVRESIETLAGKGPQDVTELTIELVTEMLDLAGKVTDRQATAQHLKQLLDDGSALKVFRDIIQAQGGDPGVVDDLDQLPQAPHQQTWSPTRDGVINRIDTMQIGLAAMALGAGRRTKEDKIDPGVGIVMHKKLGDKIDGGDPLLTIHYRDQATLHDCKNYLMKAFDIGQTIDFKPLILERLQ